MPSGLTNRRSGFRPMIFGAMSVAVLDQHAGEVRGQVEGDRLLVLDLLGRDLEARHRTRPVAQEQVLVEGEPGEVPDAQRHVGQDLLRQRGLRQGERAEVRGFVAAHLGPQLSVAEP